MEAENLLKTLRSFSIQHRVPLLLLAVGLIFFVYGLISLAGSSEKKPDMVFTNETEASVIKDETFAVDVSGAVLQPGVYKLRSSSRVQEALIAAGGLSESADRQYVAKRLNLAAKLRDGQKVYIPFAGESQALGNEDTAQQIGLISINQATISELDSLPGIGQVTAQKIIQDRPYARIEELVEKKIVSSKVFEKIKEKITVD